jgi:hypothetical protein
MYRLLERIPASPRTAGSGKSNRQRSGPSKGKTGRKVCSRRGGEPPPSSNWEASDQHGTAKRHSERSGVSCVRAVLGRGARSGDKVSAKSTCQPRRLPVVSDLPIKRLTRATRQAIEMAVTGQSALAAEQGSFAASLISSPCTGGGNSHRKGITRGKRWPHRIDSENRRELLWGSCAEAGIEAAVLFFRDSWQIVRSEALRQFA